MTQKPLSFSILLVFTLCQLRNRCEGNFDSFRSQMQEKVEAIRDELLQVYPGKCQDSTVTQCKIKSFNLCNGTGLTECLTGFPTPETCESQGIQFSRSSGIWLPNSLNISNLNDEQKQFICASAKIEDVFQNILKENDNRYSYSYVGSFTGGFRVEPSFMAPHTGSGCMNFDCRSRPWYASAVSGSKNIIIFLDVSYTMSFYHRLESEIQAAEATIDTLGTGDIFAVITFGETTSILGGFTSLQVASIANKEAIKNELQTLKADQYETNYQIAFNRGLDLMNQTRQRICDNDLIFVFFTDGKPSQGASDFTSLKNILNARLTQMNILLTFITYALGDPSNIDYTLLEELSCEYGGLLQKFTNPNENMVQKIQNYYDFLAQSTVNSAPVWTEPYTDAFGLGKILSISAPVFSSPDSYGFRRILGVAGIDVLLSQLLKYQYSTQEQVLRKISSERTCYTRRNLSECHLQALRNLKNQHGCVSTCNISQQLGCVIPQNVIFRKALEANENDNQCCPISATSIVTDEQPPEQTERILQIVLGVVMSALLIVVGVCLYINRCCCDNQVANLHPQGQSSSSIGDLHPHSDSTYIPDPDKYAKAEKSGIKIFKDEEPIDF